MNIHVARATMIGLTVIAVAAPAGAQQAPVEVAFEVPLNLTRLHPQISRVKVNCTIRSAAIIRGRDANAGPLSRDGNWEIPVSQGEVVQTAQVVITINPLDLDHPSGKQATYECSLHGRDSASLIWFLFSEGTGRHYVPTPLLTPAPALLTGSFVW